MGAERPLTCCNHVFISCLECHFWPTAADQNPKVVVVALVALTFIPDSIKKPGVVAAKSQTDQFVTEVQSFRLFYNPIPIPHPTPKTPTGAVSCCAR